jgi:hypothetical protein
LVEADLELPVILLVLALLMQVAEVVEMTLELETQQFRKVV